MSEIKNRCVGETRVSRNNREWELQERQIRYTHFPQSHIPASPHLVKKFEVFPCYGHGPLITLLQEKGQLPSRKKCPTAQAAISSNALDIHTFLDQIKRAIILCRLKIW